MNREKYYRQYKLGGFMQKILIGLGVFLMLSISANAQSPQESKPSFDCAKATTKVEKMICEDSSGELQNLDRYMAEVYMQLRNELKKSNLSDKNQRLDNLLQSQRRFITSANNINSNNAASIYKDLFNEDDEELILRMGGNEKSIIQNMYKKRTIILLKLLGEVLDSNNKELCEYARKAKFDEVKWREVPPSINPPFSIGLCAFGRNNRDVFFDSFCTQNGEIKKDKVAKAITQKSPYIEFPKSYERQIDIDNDGALEKVIITIGSYFGVLWIYKNAKLDEKASDRIYGDDLHFSGARTLENVCISSEEACAALTTYALPSNKISQRLEFYPANGGGFMPILSELSYGVMEFQGKNYITLWSKRFVDDEDSMYPTTRIYLLEGNKRELKCTY